MTPVGGRGVCRHVCLSGRLSTVPYRGTSSGTCATDIGHCISRYSTSSIDLAWKFVMHRLGGHAGYLDCESRGHPARPSSEWWPSSSVPYGTKMTVRARSPWCVALSGPTAPLGWRHFSIASDRRRDIITSADRWALVMARRICPGASSTIGGIWGVGMEGPVGGGTTSPRERVNSCVV